jgi:hypothetical protein
VRATTASALPMATVASPARPTAICNAPAPAPATSVAARIVRSDVRVPETVWPMWGRAPTLIAPAMAIAKRSAPAPAA